MEQFPAKQSIADIIKRSKKGDLEAFSSLVQMYQTRVLSLCLKLTGNRPDAEDLAQEVFIKSYKSLDGFRQEAEFGTWLHRIAVNLYINQKKKNSRVVVLSINDPVKTDSGEISREIVDDSEDPQQKLEASENRQLIRQALDMLSPEHKTVLILREIEGYSYEEIAQITKNSLGTIKSRMNRARQALKDKISQMGHIGAGKGG